MIVVALLVILLMIVLNALYVAGEFATVNARRTRVSELADQGNPLARALLPILMDRKLLDRYVAACQVGITLTSLIVGYYAQLQFTPVVVPWLTGLGVDETVEASVSVTGLLLFFTFLQVILGELLPKSIALRFPEQVATVLLRPVQASLFILRPLIAVLNGSAHWLLQRFFNRAGLEESHVHHPDELEVIFKESADGGLIDAGEREMLTRVFHLDERLARQVMVPRTRVIAAPLDSDPEELLRELVDSRHTRFPVYGDSIDDIRGVVHLRELFELVRKQKSAGQDGAGGAEKPLEEILRPLPVVPEFLTVTEVWARMRSENAAIAGVFDEYGGIAGIITIEDILEELFGEMQDEFDQEPELFEEGPQGVLSVRGDVLVSELNERYLLTLPEENVDTVGGLVMDLLEREARVGDEVEAAGVRLKVLEVEGQAVARVRLTAPRENGQDVNDE